MSPESISPSYSNSKWVDIVFLQMGGPSNLGEVKTFLYKLFSDPFIIQLPQWMRKHQRTFAKLVSTFRSRGTRKMYRKIGGGSPILEITENFAKKVDLILNNGARRYRIHLLMRYTEPRSREIVHELNRLNASHIFLYPLYPHFSRSTTASSLSDFTTVFWESYYGKKTRLSWIEDWSSEEFYVRWWVDSIVEKWTTLSDQERKSVKILFSAHALPKKYIADGDPYQTLITSSYHKIVDKLREHGISAEYSLSFQSQVGPVEWIEPATSDVIKGYAETDVSCMIVVPLGFVTDHIETLYEIDILYREEAGEVGIHNYYMISPPNDSDKFAEGVASHIIKILQQEGWVS